MLDIDKLDKEFDKILNSITKTDLEKWLLKNKNDMSLSTTSEFIQFCKYQHDIECNQKYDKILPYSFHLNLVAKQVEKFKYLVGDFEYYKVLCGAWGHDLIEDARQTYNDIIKLTGEKDIADIIYACTELRGHNRSERHGEEYIQGLRDNRLGLFVKLCDIAANAGYGLLTNSSMYEKYQKEFPELEKKLYRAEFEDLFEYIRKLLTIKTK